MKPFTTYEQQIELLKSRNLIIEDEKTAKLFLEKEGYFNVINGYKDAFLKNRKEEKYKQNIKFEDVSKLYNFDKSLRHKILILVLDIENTFKTIIAYEFAQQFGADAYLNASNYNNKNQSLQIKVSNFILNLNDQIDKNTAKNEKQYDCIRHYKNNHAFIPIWVLFNYLTFGQISNFYSLLQPSTKVAIANHISKLYDFELNTKDLYTIIRILVNLRNICAHNQRIYDYTTKFTFSTNNKLIKDLKDINENSLHNINLLLLLFYIFAKKQDFISFALFLLSGINSKVLNKIDIDIPFVNMLIKK